MSRNMGLHLAYDGTHFHGYQAQPGLRTVQGELEKALAKLLGHPCPSICAGRTDAGVHAYAQFVNFATDHPLPRLKFAPALQRLLPSDMAVIESYELPPGFNTRYRAQARHYRYLLAHGPRPNPFMRPYAWWVPWEFDRDLFQSTWEALSGTHDFQAFCKSGSHRRHCMIAVLWAQCTFYPDLLVCDIMAENFAYNMVRALVGTVLDIARGRFRPDHLQSLLREPRRDQVGVTAPPQGLYLYNVLFGPADQIHLARAGTVTNRFQRLMLGL